MLPHASISFGDNVRVRATSDTELLGLAGLVGQVFGETTPSVTGVTVIGKVVNDHALNIHFDGRKGMFWFALDLLELVDHSAGTEVRINGIHKTWVRTKTGSWTEIQDDNKK